MQSSTTSSMNFATINYSENAMTSTQVEKVTYNGSNNNYLSSLAIDGVELNTTFNKENSNYFVEIQNQTSLNVTAVAEDETAKVVITGEDNITSSESKILISVTAENGDIRYYRIFVTAGGIE